MYNVQHLSYIKADVIHYCVDKEVPAENIINMRLFTCFNNCVTMKVYILKNASKYKKKKDLREAVTTYT